MSLPSLMFRVLTCAVLGALAVDARAAITQPIAFVGQVPLADDPGATTVASAFGSHLPDIAKAPRGGDLFIRYPDGSVRNLTREAGFGTVAAMQGASAIAVRDPTVHWSGNKILFSMVIGAPTQQGGAENYTWQLYEVTNLQQGGPTAVVTPVPNQPTGYNNTHPAYLSDGTIVFVSDRPVNGAAHLYPLRDEYRTDLTNTGIWHLDPSTGALRVYDHAPSGSFHPFVDSFGRVLFTRWDHLQQDANLGNATGGFDYASELLGAATQTGQDLYPEPLSAPVGANYRNFEFNQFFPWMMGQDGTGDLTLNHLGRHELRFAVGRTFTDDPNLVDFQSATSGRTNPNFVNNVLMSGEDPNVAGRYLAVDTQEFGMFASGQIVAFGAAPGTNAASVTVQYVSNRATAFLQANANNIGHFRDPLPTSGGDLVAAFTATPGAATNGGTVANPQPNYAFRLYRLTQNGGVGDFVPGTTLTPGSGIARSVQFFNPGTLVMWSGNLWEIQPVEVRARAAPSAVSFGAVAAPEAAAFTQTGVSQAAFRQFLTQNQLGLVVVRNITARDAADRQQPFNLRVPGGVQTTGAGGTIYDLGAMQVFQGDAVRGVGNVASPQNGRRTVPRPLHDAIAQQHNPPDVAGIAGAKALFADGSVAMFVPAGRALTWQSLSPNGLPLVRERYWVTIQPGEIRVCDGCHGVNQGNQAGAPSATNTAQALIALLTQWQATQGTGDAVFKNDFE